MSPGLSRRALVIAVTRVAPARRGGEAGVNPRDDLIEAVAYAMCIPTKKLLSRSRDHFIVRARWVLWGCQARRGLNMSEIGRLYGYDAGTVWHGLHELPKHAELVKTVEALTQQDLAGANIMPLRVLPMASYYAVLDYLEVLTAGRRMGARAYQGLYLIAVSPRARSAAMAVLENAQLSQHAWRVQLHARQAGLRWELDRTVS